MNTLKDYVNWKLTHADKVAEAEGYPLTMENCKRNKRMKQLEVYGNSVQDGTPTPDNPVEVQSVGEKSVNLFDKDNFVYVSSWNVSKANVSSTDTGISFVINDKIGHVHLSLGLASDYAGKTLVLTSTSNYSTNTRLVIRNPSGEAVKTSSTIGNNNGNGLYSTTLTIEEDTYTNEVLCIRLYFQEEYAEDGTILEAGSVLEYKDIMVAESNTPLPYEPYGKYKIPLVQRGINLFDVKTYPLTTGHWINGNTGLYLVDKMYAATPDFIPCADLIGKTITISRTGGSNPGIAFYDDNKTYVSGKGNGNSAYTKLTTTVPENAVYYRFCVVADYKDTAQIQEGSTVLPYESYVEPTTTNIFLDEPLRKIGDYADYIDFKNNKVVRNIGVLNSTQINKQNIMKYASDAYGYNNSYRFAAFGLLNTNDRNLKLAYSNLLSGGGFFTSAPLTSISYSSGGFLYLRFDDENNYGVTDIATCKQWIAQNNLLINYVRNKATEESLNIELPQLPKLNAKTTIVEVDTSLAPSNSYGKYIKK